jgi:hypothetical protein
MSGLDRVRLVAIVAPMLAIAAIVTSCDPDSRIDSRNPQLANGWVTNCAGPAFSQFSQGGNAGPGPERPVFRINDQLVLAVPKKNWPSAGKFDREPPECRQISDLPPAPYLTFVISGNWSAGYKPEDVPIVGGNKQFQPDVVAVRIEPEFSKFSEEEQQERQQSLRASAQQDSTATREIGGLTCFVPKLAPEWPSCFGIPTRADAYFTTLRYRTYGATPFILVLADYPSSRYGGIHVFWKAWTSDVSHVPDIDVAIWKSIEDWNLLNKTEAQAGQR